MKFIKYIVAPYLMLFFFSFQIIHASWFFNKYHHKINIPVKTFSDSIQNKYVDFEDDDNCPLCRFVAAVSLFVNIDNPIIDENIIFREKDNNKTFPKIEYYSTLNNKSPPIVL